MTIEIERVLPSEVIALCNKKGIGKKEAWRMIKKQKIMDYIANSENLEQIKVGIFAMIDYFGVQNDN